VLIQNTIAGDWRIWSIFALIASAILRRIAFPCAPLYIPCCGLYVQFWVSYNHPCYNLHCRYAALITVNGRKVSLVIRLVSASALLSLGNYPNQIYTSAWKPKFASSFVGVVIFTLIAVGERFPQAFDRRLSKSIERQNIQTYEIINERAFLK
jgi:hypothetical protein